MMFEVRLVYKDTQIMNRGKEDEQETPVFVNVHIRKENLSSFIKSIEEKKAYWIEDDKGAFWTNPDLLRTIQAFPIMEEKDEEDAESKKISKGDGQHSSSEDEIS